jgi:hypothetical protein
LPDIERPQRFLRRSTSPACSSFGTRTLTLQGVIVTDTGERDSADQRNRFGTVRFSLELRAAQRNGQWVPATGTMLVFVDDAREVGPLRYGDLIRFSAVLRVPAPMRNPGAFDWRGGWSGAAFISPQRFAELTLLDVEAHDRGNPVIATALQLSRYLNARCDSASKTSRRWPGRWRAW